MSVISLALKQLPQALLAVGSRAELQPCSSVRLCSLGFSLHYPNKSVGISSEVSTRGAVTPCPALSHKNGKYLQLLPGMRKVAFPTTLMSGHHWNLEEAGSFSFETSLYKGRVLCVWQRNNKSLCFNNILIICNIIYIWLVKCTTNCFC